MDKDLNLMSAVREAKEAVHDLEEPLKTEAFKIVLNKLLSGQLQTFESPSDVKKKNRKTKGSAKTTIRKDTKNQSLKSSLSFSVDQLRDLKNYCTRFDLEGSEQVAFIIANFLREKVELEKFNASDIDYCYRSLISQRVKMTVKINDLQDWNRALSWLSSKSRKKEWIKRNNNGFEVSNAGLIAFHDLEAEIERSNVLKKNT